MAKYYKPGTGQNRKRLPVTNFLFPKKRREDVSYHSLWHCPAQTTRRYPYLSLLPPFEIQNIKHANSKSRWKTVLIVSLTQRPTKAQTRFLSLWFNWKSGKLTTYKHYLLFCIFFYYKKLFFLIRVILNIYNVTRKPFLLHCQPYQGPDSVFMYFYTE